MAGITESLCLFLIGSTFSSLNFYYVFILCARQNKRPLCMPSCKINVSHFIKRSPCVCVCISPFSPLPVHNQSGANLFVLATKCPAFYILSNKNNCILMCIDKISFMRNGAFNGLFTISSNSLPLNRNKMLPLFDRNYESCRPHISSSRKNNGTRWYCASFELGGLCTKLISCTYCWKW